MAWGGRLGRKARGGDLSEDQKWFVVVRFILAGSRSALTAFGLALGILNRLPGRCKHDFLDIAWGNPVCSEEKVFFIGELLWLGCRLDHLEIRAAPLRETIDFSGVAFDVA